jgi:hypothetical protein
MRALVDSRAYVPRGTSEPGTPGTKPDTQPRARHWIEPVTVRATGAGATLTVQVEAEKRLGLR